MSGSNPLLISPDGLTSGRQFPTFNVAPELAGPLDLETGTSTTFPVSPSIDVTTTPHPDAAPGDPGSQLTPSGGNANTFPGTGADGLPASSAGSSGSAAGLSWLWETVSRAITLLAGFALVMLALAAMFWSSKTVRVVHSDGV